jgi:glutamine synthetase
MFKDPFRGGNNIIVLASTYNSDGSPNKTNHRHHAAQTMELAKQAVPWFGLEQEYTLLDMDDRPYGWPKGGFPGPQGPYYCGAGKFSHHIGLIISNFGYQVPGKLLPVI